MPTTVTHTIKASGGDYTSLASWEAAQQRNLVALDEIAVAECYPFIDATTSATSISGWTTGVNNYIEIRAHPSARATLPMTTDGSRYLLRCSPPSTATTALSVQQAYTRILDIQIENLGVNTNQSTIVPTTNTTFRNCVARVSGDNNSCWFFQGGSGIRLQNCVAIVNNLIDSSNRRCFTHDNASVQYDNCTAIFSGNASGFRVNGSTVNGIILRNCLAVNVTRNANCFSLSATGLGITSIDLTKSTNNLSNDNSAYGVNPRLGQRPIFVNPSIGDYHLDWMDAVAQGNGANLSASDTGSFSDDFDGNTRTTWHIGAAGISTVPGVVQLGNIGNSNVRLGETGTSNVRIT